MILSSFESTLGGFHIKYLNLPNLWDLFKFNYNFIYLSFQILVAKLNTSYTLKLQLAKK